MPTRRRYGVPQKRKAPARAKPRPKKVKVIEPPTAVEPIADKTIPVPQDQPALVVPQTQPNKGFNLPGIASVIGALAGIGLTAGAGVALKRRYNVYRDYTREWPDYSYTRSDIPGSIIGRV